MIIRYSPVGSWVDDAINNACPISAGIKTMQAKVVELGAWQSTGIYTWQEMADITAEVVRLASAASSAATMFFSGPSTPAGRDAVRRAADKYNEIARQVHSYMESYQAARAQNVVVSAPGFRQWLIDDLKAAIDLFRTVELAVCTQPWWVASSVAIAAVFIDIANTAKRIGKTVLKLGEAAVDAAESASGIMAFLIRVAPYAALGVGGYVAYQYVKKKR